MAGRISYLGGIVTQGLVLDLDAAKRDSYVGTGTAWNDISGNRNNGTLINGPTFNAGNGGSIVFDGSNDYYNISTPITDIMNTINIWVNMLATTVCPILYYGSDTFDSNLWTWGIAIFPSSTHGFSEAPVNYPTTALYTESITTNVWKNFTLVRNDSGNVRLYKNGILVGSKIGLGTTALRNSADRLYIAKAGTTYGNFQISQTLIYNRALSASEVLQNYNATKGRYL
jgi:hypothetical protein